MKALIINGSKYEKFNKTCYFFKIQAHAIFFAYRTDVLTIYGVRDMYNYTFHGTISFKDSIKSVVISFGVISIGNNVFSNCTELSSITIPSSVKSIVNFAF